MLSNLQYETIKKELETPQTKIVGIRLWETFNPTILVKGTVSYLLYQLEQLKLCRFKNVETVTEVELGPERFILYYYDGRSMNYFVHGSGFTRDYNKARILTSGDFAEHLTQLLPELYEDLMDKKIKTLRI